MPRLLLVEDSPTQAQDLAWILQNAGFEVETAPDAEQGWERLGEGFDLVLSDLMLPGASGFQFCRRIKADAARLLLPVILITRWSDPGNVLRGLEAGADGFITKGLEPEETVRRLRHALDRPKASTLPGREEQTPVVFQNQSFRVAADRGQLLEILLDTFEDVVRLDQGRQEELTQRRRAEQEVLTLNTELERRVAERTTELARSNRLLAQRNEENEMFVYSVSHDLRSPLVNLEGFSRELGLASHDLRDLLLDPGVPADVRQRGLALLAQGIAEPISFIQTAVARLSGIIDALLQLSRAGRVVYQWQVVETGPVVARIVKAMSDTVTRCGATVSVRNLPPAWGDPTAVERIFANLIGNALNYLDPRRPGQVEVGAGPSSGDAAGWRTYFVRDNGLGIPEAYRAKLFQAFQRLHPKAAPGEGMGLAIVRRLVERHGGRIWVESAAGVGSTFFFTLPAPPDPAAPPTSGRTPHDP